MSADLTPTASLGDAPIPLSAAMLEAIKTWAAEDRYWQSRSATEFNLCTFARLILKLSAPLAAASPAPPEWQPIETAPRDRFIIGALIRDGRAWRVHEMKHNGLAFYTTAGGSLPQMTHWTEMLPVPAREPQAEGKP